MDLLHCLEGCQKRCAQVQQHCFNWSHTTSADAIRCRRTGNARLAQDAFRAPAPAEESLLDGSLSLVAGVAAVIL